MSQIEKLLKKFKAKPESVKYRDLVKLLLHLGFEQIDAKGSHVKFKHPRLTYDIVIPVHKGECKDFYKKQVLKQIKDLVK